MYKNIDFGANGPMSVEINMAVPDGREGRVTGKHDVYIVNNHDHTNAGVIDWFVTDEILIKKLFPEEGLINIKKKENNYV